jgi:toxin ParE1/3/4
VAKARYTRAAAADLDGIGVYTRKSWGKAQELKYLGELERCCKSLASNSQIGRKCDEVRAGLRRLEQGQHVIFYRENGDGILVVRVLHRAMLPSRWNMGE